jgi:hypothetical protein
MTDPDPYPSIISINSKKTLDSYCFVTLSLKDDVNVPSKGNNNKNLEKNYILPS